MKKSLFMSIGLVGIASAPLSDYFGCCHRRNRSHTEHVSQETLSRIRSLSQLSIEKIEIRMMSGEPANMKGKKVILNGECVRYSKDVIYEGLGDGKSCFCFDKDESRVGKITRDGLNFTLVRLHNQVNGELANFLFTIFERHKTSEYMERVEWNGGFSPKSRSRETFDYVVRSVRSLVEDIDPNIKVAIEDMTAEDKGIIRCQYVSTDSTEEITLRFLANPA